MNMYEIQILNVCYNESIENSNTQLCKNLCTNEFKDLRIKDVSIKEVKHIKSKYTRI